MSGAMSRRKGHVYQSGSRDWWRAQAPVSDVLELGGAGAETTDYLVVAGRLMLSVEAKNQQAMALAAWVDQAVRQAPANCVPVVHHKRKGKGDHAEDYVTMRAGDLARLLAAANQ